MKTVCGFYITDFTTLSFFLCKKGESISLPSVTRERKSLETYFASTSTIPAVKTVRTVDRASESWPGTLFVVHYMKAHDGENTDRTKQGSLECFSSIYCVFLSL